MNGNQHTFLWSILLPGPGGKATLEARLEERPQHHGRGRTEATWETADDLGRPRFNHLLEFTESAQFVLYPPPTRSSALVGYMPK